MAFDPARAKSLFLNACELTDPDVRAAYLDGKCGDDVALRARVEALLAAAGPSQPDSLLRAIGGTEVPPGKSRVATWNGLPRTEQGTGVSGAGGPSPTIVARSVRSLNGANSDDAPVARPTRFHPGQVIGGRYTLLEVLGEGGMGTVFKAEQSRPVRRVVALKLVRLGMDSRTVLARFDAERQALALMDHPNIARVFDGGATDADQPYFVMEYVQGIPITDYCDEHQLNVPGRLALFVAVCQAVQHAHQKGVIHRDLKPSNVLVTEVDGRPTPKVIDFGVAKATGASLTDHTLGDTGAIVGTPTYMSPEQADPSSMDIDTRTDVYALGVILYELLAGSPPLDPTQIKRGALLEMLRMVREVDPAKPSTRVSTADALPDIAANRGIEPGQLKHALSGDLDWIVMKALEKDRTRRYETANGLGADIQRHLASEPVHAAPPSHTYRLRKFTRKNRVAVAAASLVLMALVAGVAGTTWGLLEARHSARSEREARLLAQANEKRARAAAEEEKKAKETVKDVLDFVETHVFAAARPLGLEGGRGYNVSLADAITAAVPSIATGFADRPLTLAQLRLTIGQSFLYLGKLDLALGQFKDVVAINQRLLGRDHPDTLASMTHLANCYNDLGRHDEAVELHQEILALRKARLGPTHPDTLASMNDLAATDSTPDRVEAAVLLYRETLDLQKDRLGLDHPDTLRSMSGLANCYNIQLRHAEAAALHKEVLELRRKTLGPEHPDTFWTMNDLASDFVGLKRHAEAVALYKETLRLREARLGPDHPYTLASRIKLAGGYAALGDHVAAVGLLEKSLELQRLKLGPAHPDTLETMEHLANTYAILGRNSDAIGLRGEMLALQREKLGPAHPETVRNMSILANIYETSGERADALRIRQEMRASQQANLGPDHPDTLKGMTNLANLFSILGRHAEAIKFHEEAQGLRKRKLDPGRPDVLATLMNLIDALNSLDGEDEADESGVPMRTLRKGAHGWAQLRALGRLVGLTRSDSITGPTIDARSIRGALAALRKASLDRDQLIVLNSMPQMIRSYLALGRTADAVELREDMLALQKVRLGPDHLATFETMSILIQDYVRSGRTFDALSLLETYSAAHPADGGPNMMIASLRAWFGQEEEFNSVRRRVMEYARGTNDVYQAETAAKVASLRPSSDREELDAMLVLGRQTVKPDDRFAYRPNRLLARGMAEYRAGAYEACEAALVAAGEEGVGSPWLENTAAFYRAMSLHRRGHVEEARNLAGKTAAVMKPLPPDHNHPLADGANHDDLILWLAYREAKALIGFDAPAGK